MCQVNITGYTYTSSEPLTSGEIRYRLQGSSVWINTMFDINTNLTPNIQEIGVYEYQIRLANSSGFGSWSSSGIFNVEECG